MKNKEVTNFVEKLRKKTFEAKRVCLAKDCDSFAINSHLLQKRGIINNISDNTNQVYELSYDLFKPNHVIFKRRSINDAFTFKGFCNLHDTKIFKSIEDGSNIFTDYESQILYAYRSTMMEIRKKELVVDFFERILKSLTLDGYINKEHLYIVKEQHKKGINDGLWYKQQFENEIFNNGKRNFTFATFQYKKLPCCISGGFNYESGSDIRTRMKEVKTYTLPLPTIFVNVLPTENETKIILGCHNDYQLKCSSYINKFHHLLDEEFEIELSKIIKFRMETWICSPVFYDTHIKPKEISIIKHITEGMNRLEADENSKFNIFRNT